MSVEKRYQISTQAEATSIQKPWQKHKYVPARDALRQFIEDTLLKLFSLLWIALCIVPAAVHPYPTGRRSSSTLPHPNTHK